MLIIYCLLLIIAECGFGYALGYTPKEIFYSAWTGTSAVVGFWIFQKLNKQVIL